MPGRRRAPSAESVRARGGGNGLRQLRTFEKWKFPSVGRPPSAALPKRDGARQVFAGRDGHFAVAGHGAAVERLLEGRGVFGLTVSDRTKVADVERQAPRRMPGSSCRREKKQKIREIRTRDGRPRVFMESLSLRSLGEEKIFVVSEKNFLDRMVRPT